VSEPFDQDTESRTWHRYFAIEFNNRAWDLAEKVSRSAAETEEMLNAAHSAASHWNVIGTDLNRMRARALLAQVCALAGMGDFALPLAEEVRSYFLSRETEAWEIALVQSIHANAAARAGAQDKHRHSYEAARSAIEAISNAEERATVMRSFSQVPLP